MIFTTYWDKASEREVLEMATDPSIAGIIFSMIPQQPHMAEEVSKLVPMVAVGDRTYNLKLDTVDVNNYSAGRMVPSYRPGPQTCGLYIDYFKRRAFFPDETVRRIK